MDQIKLTKRNNIKGLIIYCNQCDKQISANSIPSKSKSNCSHSHQWVYKMIVYIPGSNGKTKTKKLNAKNEIDAISEALKFRQDMASCNYSNHWISSDVLDPQKICLGMAIWNHR